MSEPSSEKTGNIPAGVLENVSQTAVEDSVQALSDLVKDEHVILGLSGGVDSSVVAALLSQAIGKQLTCIFVNHGLLRENEPEQVQQVFTTLFNVDFVYVDAVERYLEALAGISAPEEKRSIIGSLFWTIFFEEAEKIAQKTGAPVKFLAQGTIYPDVLESSKAVKSHHNLVPFPAGVSFELIEPLQRLYKHQVRELGILLGLPTTSVYRQPFPGPGLAVRIIGDVSADKLAILKEADAIVRAEIDAYNETLFKQTGIRDSEHSVWQYFAVLPDVKSVGVVDGQRNYERPIILRAIESRDAMTARWAQLPYELLDQISQRIVNEVEGINRVLFDITSKPPATIEWE